MIINVQSGILSEKKFLHEGSYNHGSKIFNDKSFAFVARAAVVLEDLKT